MNRVLLQEVAAVPQPELLAEHLRSQPGLIVLRSAYFESPRARYSFVAARPFFTFRCFGSSCELTDVTGTRRQFGNPWHLLAECMARYELLDELDVPFPLGGCFGFWGYGLKQFMEPKLRSRAPNDLELPDCHVGFYGSLLVTDHRLGKSWIVATGMMPDGSRSDEQARLELGWWQTRLEATSTRTRLEEDRSPRLQTNRPRPTVISNCSRAEFIRRANRAREYIRAGDIYQVNLSHRLTLEHKVSSLELFEALLSVSPAPFAAYLECGDFQIVSSSPEMFLRMSGGRIETRPIKGTRPRSPDPTRDAQLAYDLQSSPKETAELIMITDLLRNDLGKVCEFGSVQTPELVRLERYPQVQHLVSAVEGRLRTEVDHLKAFASCFPGGSITGAPKFRAMEIIDELEQAGRGPYTGALGYLGFNRESQLSIIIRAAICTAEAVYFPVGAGIVADSRPEHEYEETLAKAQGFLDALSVDTSQLIGKSQAGSLQ